MHSRIPKFYLIGPAPVRIDVGTTRQSACGTADLSVDLVRRSRTPMAPESMMTQHVFDPYTEDFDEAFDVVVVGFGFAGAVSAISSHDASARVLLIEKMPDPGGISICSGGGLRLAEDVAAARAYLNSTNGDATPEPINTAFANAMMELDAYVNSLAQACGATTARVERLGNYPFEGFDRLYFLEIDTIPGFDSKHDYPAVKALRGGPKMFRVLQSNVEMRAFDVRYQTRAHNLIFGPKGEVRGIWIESDAGPRAVAAHKGVILACGGFESDPEMQQQFWQIGPVASAAFRGNTGDGVRMATAAGADLWHMWHFHGSYGFRHPDPAFPMGIRLKSLPAWTPKAAPSAVPMSWILVDRDGRRFANEYQPYMQDTGHRALELIEPTTMDHPRMPCHLIVDDIGRQMYPLGSVVYNDRDVTPLEWSADNLAEVDAGLLKRADSIDELADLIGCDAKHLTATLTRWNDLCRQGTDTDFGRPVASMISVQTPPFFVADIWPVVSNTQGGPRHDAQQRVLNGFSQPIPRLYVAGELGSIWGFLYLSGGNLTECFVSGRKAGEDAASLTPWR